MLEAPKKPATPVVWSRTYWASSGSAIGPPWQRTMIVGLDLGGGVADRLDPLGGGLERQGRRGPDLRPSS